MYMLQQTILLRRAVLRIMMPLYKLTASAVMAAPEYFVTARWPCISCQHISCAHSHVLLTHSHVLLTHSHVLLTHSHVLLTHSHVLLTHSHDPNDTLASQQPAHTLVQHILHGFCSFVFDGLLSNTVCTYTQVTTAFTEQVVYYTGRASDCDWCPGGAG